MWSGVEQAFLGADFTAVSCNDSMVVLISYYEILVFYSLGNYLLLSNLTLSQNFSSKSHLITKMLVFPLRAGVRVVWAGRTHGRIRHDLLRCV